MQGMKNSSFHLSQPTAIPHTLTSLCRRHTQVCGLSHNRFIQVMKGGDLLIEYQSPFYPHGSCRLETQVGSFAIQASVGPFSVDSSTELLSSLPSELSLWYMGLSVRSGRGGVVVNKSKIFPRAPVTHPFPRSLLQSGIVLLMRSFKLFHVNEESPQSPRDISGMDGLFACTSASPQSACLPLVLELSPLSQALHPFHHRKSLNIL